jgi:hypothetical protein
MKITMWTAIPMDWHSSYPIPILGLPDLSHAGQMGIFNSLIGQIVRPKILVEIGRGKHFGIGIENKPRAGDQFNHVNRNCA